jgi:hypothetical protein
MTERERKTTTHHPITGSQPGAYVARWKLLCGIMYIAAIAVSFLAFARDSIEPSIYLYRESNGSLGELAVVGWLISTAAPVSVSLLLFVYISRFKTRWLVHLFLSVWLQCCSG